MDKEPLHNISTQSHQWIPRFTAVAQSNPSITLSSSGRLNNWSG